MRRNKRKKKLFTFIIIGIIAIIAMIVLLLVKVNATPTDEWGDEEGTICYYDSEGFAVTGWVQIAPEEGSPNDEEWCYFDDAGEYIACFGKKQDGRQGVLVDISKQMLYFFEDGDITFSAHIISGTKGKDDTPLGEYAIISKNKDTRIVGPTWDYDHVVWMAFIGQEYGLHSAWWQNDELFDDPTTYYEHGSHGCINMREKDALTLFDLVKKGTPVVIQK